MNNELLTAGNLYGSLINDIGNILVEARGKICREINSVMVDAYWNIGKYIVEYEQKGEERAEYGSNLLNRLSKEYLNKDDLEKKIEFSGNLQIQKESILKNIASYEKRVRELSKGIRELYMDKVKGLISDADYAEMSKDFTGDRDRLEELISDGRRQIEEIEGKIKAGDNRREIIERYTNLKHLNREMVEVLIDYISVGKRIPGTRSVPIEIHWNF